MKNEIPISASPPAMVAIPWVFLPEGQEDRNWSRRSHWNSRHAPVNGGKTPPQTKSRSSGENGRTPITARATPETQEVLHRHHQFLEVPLRRNLQLEWMDYKAGLATQLRTKWIQWNVLSKKMKWWGAFGCCVSLGIVRACLCLPVGYAFFWDFWF
jgi:hypothetical protein